MADQVREYESGSGKRALLIAAIICTHAGEPFVCTFSPPSRDMLHSLGNASLVDSAQAA